MIPKIIHYCWFGGNPLPPLALECIASWRKYLPGYEVWMWVEDPSQPFLKGLEFVADKVMTFDVNTIPYTAEAYRQKKYAFVSDYARFDIIYNYGGIYFDTDVEVIKPIDDIISKGAFMGVEQKFRKWRPIPKGSHGLKMVVNTGLGFGAEEGNDVLKAVIGKYSNMCFHIEERMVDQETVVHVVTRTLIEYGMEYCNDIQTVGGIRVYPVEYFSPTNVTTGRLHITDNTRSIHHYSGTWTNSDGSQNRNYKDFLPEFLHVLLSDIKNFIRQ